MVKKFNQQFRVGQGGIKEVNSDTSLVPGEDQLVLVDASAAPVTLTLAQARGWGGKRVCIKKTDSSTNVVTIAAIAGETVCAASTTELIIENQVLDIISDNENWLEIGEATGNQVSAVKSFLYAANNISQITDILANDHVKFDTVLQSRGSNITLDTTTVYTAALGVASIGRLTLKAGKTYKITAQVPIIQGASGAIVMDMLLRDVTSVAVLIGKGSGVVGDVGGGNTGYSGNTVFATITPTVDSLIEYTIGSNVGVTTILAETTVLNRAPIILVEEI